MRVRAVLVNWAISSGFPVLVGTFGSTVTFFAFVVLGVVALAFSVRCLPETESRSLEEIESAMQTHSSPAARTTG